MISRPWRTREFAKHGKGTMAMADSCQNTQKQTQRAPCVLMLLVFLLAAAQPALLGQGKRVQTQSAIGARLQEAEDELRAGQLDEAKGKVQEELAANPSSIEAYNLLGIIYGSEKDYPHALEAFEHALKLSPNSFRTRNNLGNLYVTQNRLDLAEREFREVLRRAPANADANYNLALVLMARGSFPPAILLLQRVHPATVASRSNLVRALLRAGRTKEGLAQAEELSAQNRDDVQVHFTLGVLLASEKQYQAAELELEKASALRPETPEILYSLGQLHLHSGEPAKAELELERALRLQPDSPDVLYLLGQAYTDQSRPVDALDALIRAHKLAPQNTDIIFLLARVSMSQNYFEDAIPLLKSGLQIAPKRPDLHAALGESYFMSGKTEKAIEEFEKLIALDPSARSYAFLGLSYRHLGRFEEAKKYFQEGLKRDPHNAACLFNLGFIEERQGNNRAAEQLFRQALQSNPNFPEALLELANLRIAGKRFEEALVLLRRFVRLSRSPAPGYYKLAMVERSLHQDEAAERDLGVFQSLSKDASTGPYPFQNLFEYLNNRSTLSAQARTQLDLKQLIEETSKHPDQPQNLYLLAEAYLKLGNAAGAREAVAQLDELSANDYRTQTGVGVLLARYRLYAEAITHFGNALRLNPESDDVKFDLADAYFRKGAYQQALDTAQQVSAQGQADDAYLALLGDIQAHLGNTARAAEIFEAAIGRNPDNDQDYLSLALVELRQDNLGAAREILQKGLSRIPNSGKITWGLGLVSVLEGNTREASDRLERAVDLLPEWSGSYSVLGAFYYQTGQIAKAKEVLLRFKGSRAAGGLDVRRIEEALADAPNTPEGAAPALPTAARQQLFQLALSFADRTL